MLILILCCFLTGIKLNAQVKFKVGNNGINGIYSGLIKSSKKSKPQLVNIYIYEYIQYNSEIKFLCQIEKYQTKKAKGVPIIYQYYGYASGISDGTYEMKSSVKVGSQTSRFKMEISELILLSNGKFVIQGKKLRNSSQYSLIDGTYEKKSVENEDYDRFLRNIYNNIIGSYKPYRGKENVAYWGKAYATVPKAKYSWQQKKLTPIFLTTSFYNIEDLHNNQTIEVMYYDSFTVISGTRMEFLSNKLDQAFNYNGGQRDKNPLIYYFPYLKNISVKNFKTGEITHTVDVHRDFYKFRFTVTPTTLGLTKTKKEKQDKRLAEEALIQKEKEKRLLIEEAKAKKDKKDSEVGYNPSGIILNIEKKPRGTRNKAGEILYGKEYNDAINKLSGILSQKLNNSEDVNVIDAEKYFKNIFYGNFVDLKPEKVSKGLLGSINYFPEFHNAFLFYAYQELGESYYPNMTTVNFKTSTTRTPFEIVIPKVFSNTFMSYLDENQFSWSGEHFDREFEYLMLSFFERYSPDSLVFKQMMQNLYRYANGLKPVRAKSELIKF